MQNVIHELELDGCDNGSDVGHLAEPLIQLV